MIVEDAVQTKNDELDGLHAPLFANYPAGGQIEALPMVLTWVVNIRTDTANVLDTYSMKSAFYIEKTGQDNWARAKQRTRAWLTTVLDHYRVGASNNLIGDSAPAITIDPDSIQLSGVELTIDAPNGEPHHGFELTFTATLDNEEC